MSTNKIIRLANYFNNKYNLSKFSTGEYDWSETIDATRQGQEQDNPVLIPEIRPVAPNMKSTITPQRPQTSPIIYKIKSKIENLKRYYSKDTSNLANLANIEKKLTDILKDTSVNPKDKLSELYTEVSDIEAKEIASALV